MARTFTEQVVVYNDGSGGSSGLTGDGEGLHSMLFHDACRGLNNMAVKCNNFGQYAQGLNTGFISRGISGAGYQMFIGQFPVLIPPWRQRMLWTAGVEVTDGTANDVIVYLSPSAYTGPDPDTEAFDQGNVPLASVGSVNLGVSSGYALADNSGTGQSIPKELWVYDSVPTHGVVIITIDADDDTSVLMRDFTCWFSPE